MTYAYDALARVATRDDSGSHLRNDVLVTMAFPLLASFGALTLRRRTLENAKNESPRR
jgi:hypothetical protein